MSSGDIDYFCERAAVERALAEAATNPTVASVHDELARGYEALVRTEEQRTRMRIVAPLQGTRATA